MLQFLKSIYHEVSDIFEQVIFFCHFLRSVLKLHESCNEKICSVVPTRRQIRLHTYVKTENVASACSTGKFVLHLARGYKSFFMLNSAENEMYPAHKCQQSIVGILTFISSINDWL